MRMRWVSTSLPAGGARASALSQFSTASSQRQRLTRMLPSTTRTSTFSWGSRAKDRHRLTTARLSSH